MIVALVLAACGGGSQGGGPQGAAGGSQGASGAPQDPGGAAPAAQEPEAGAPAAAASDSGDDPAAEQGEEDLSGCFQADPVPADFPLPVPEGWLVQTETVNNGSWVLVLCFQGEPDPAQQQYMQQLQDLGLQVQESEAGFTARGDLDGRTIDASVGFIPAPGLTYADITLWGWFGQ